MAEFSPTRFHELLRTETFGRSLIFEATVGSTMDVARDAARHGAPEGTVAVADEQTAGRGRLGRGWVTPSGANIACTLVLRPPQHVVRQIAMIAPLAVAGAVQDVTGVHCDIKWPNDVQVGGKKLSGVLIETMPAEGDAIVALVGTGINVNFDPREHEEIRDIATSVSVVTGGPVEREPLLAAYLHDFEQLYAEARAGASMRDRWRARLVTLGQRVTVTTPSARIEGVAEDVDIDGALLVRRDDGSLETIEAGDVTLRE